MVLEISAPVPQSLQKLEVKKFAKCTWRVFCFLFFFTLGSPTGMMKVAVTFAIFHAPAHSIFFPGATYMVQ